MYDVYKSDSLFLIIIDFFLYNFFIVKSNCDTQSSIRCYYRNQWEVVIVAVKAHVMIGFHCLTVS